MCGVEYAFFCTFICHFKGERQSIAKMEYFYEPEWCSPMPGFHGNHSNLSILHEQHHFYPPLFILTVQCKILILKSYVFKLLCNRIKFKLTFWTFHHQSFSGHHLPSRRRRTLVMSGLRYTPGYQWHHINLVIVQSTYLPS